MGPGAAVERAQAKRQNRPKIHNQTAALEHAVRVIYRVCCLAGSASLIDDLAAELDEEGVRAAMRAGDSGPVFDWLLAALSYQGISDRIADAYMAAHGRLSWGEIERQLAAGATCPRLKSYWHFHGCRYRKLSRTCAEPAHIRSCPLPSHDLRNAHLNQTGYSLALFIRDLTDGDLLGWIDGQLQAASSPPGPDRLARMRAALLDPLRHVYGVADKVLTMSLSALLLAAPKRWRLWREVGASMIAIDTLVHKFLHRTGILHRFDAEHAYGAGCYRPGGCAEIIAAVAERIDASAFNASFPPVFPRFVQHAIWRYCAQDRLAICNGNRIDDRTACENVYCQLYNICDKRPVYSN
jgi:hypothetical protein